MTPSAQISIFVEELYESPDAIFNYNYFFTSGGINLVVPALTVSFTLQ
jgi:hypothetical protein